MNTITKTLLICVCSFWIAYPTLAHEHSIKTLAKPLESYSKSLEEDTKCLSQTIYYETRGKSLSVSLAVANSVINRALKRHTSVCVEIARKHQYSWVSKKTAGKHTKEYYSVAKKLLEDEIEGIRKDNTFGSTHFTRKHIKNHWTKAFKVVYSDKYHSFYKES